MIEQLRELDPVDFEYLLADLFERDGWETTEVVGGSGDRGIDVIATALDGQRTLVQAKRYGEENKVGSPEIQRYGSLWLRGDDIDAVIVVTTSRFTEQAIEVAGELDVALLDGSGLVEFIERVDGRDLLEEYSGRRVSSSRSTPTDWSGLLSAANSAYRRFRALSRLF